MLPSNTHLSSGFWPNAHHHSRAWRFIFVPRCRIKMLSDNYQYHRFAQFHHQHASDVLATCLPSWVCNLFSPGNLASFWSSSVFQYIFWTSDLLYQYWFHPLQPSNSMLIDKGRPSSILSLSSTCPPLLLQPQTPSPALIILPERRKSLFC